MAADADHPRLDPAVDHHRRAGDVCRRPDAQHHDARRLRARGRHPRRQRHGGDREHRAPCRPGRAADASDRRRRRRGRRADRALDALHLHRLRAGLPAAGNRQIPVLAVVAVGLRVARRQPRALLHAGAGAVQVSHALRGRGARGGAGAAGARLEPVQHGSIAASSTASIAFAKAIATASPGRCRSRWPRLRSSWC